MTDYRQRDIRKSAFVQQTTIPEGATLDFVVNGQNYKISKADFLTAVGTVGELIQKGDIAAVPVLTKDGTINYIRNILAGYGIAVSLTAEDGIRLDHNFINGSGGVDLIDDLTVSQPVLKNITAGDGITISGSSTGVQISTAAGPPVATNTVIVNEMSDFPAPVGGIITLATDTQYFIQNNLTTADRFVFSEGSVLSGADAQIASITYTASGIFITASGVYCKVNDLTITCATGTFVDWSSTPGSGDQLVLRSVLLTAATLGTVSNCDGFTVNDCNLFCTTNGFLFENSNAIISATDFVSSLSAGKLFDFGTSVNGAISIRNGIVIAAGGTYIISGLVDSGNITAGRIGNVINVRLSGAGSFSENIVESDNLWEFIHNDGIPDSINSILARISSVTITISVISTPVQVGASWVFGHERRFEGTAAGRLTYKGKGAHVNINASITATGLVPSSRNYEFLLYLNGVAIPNAVFARSFNNSGSGSISLVWQEDLETDDYLELWLQNTDSTDNLLVDNIILGVS